MESPSFFFGYETIRHHVPMWNYKPWSAQGKLFGLLALDSLLAWHQGDQVAGSSLGTDEIFGPEDGMFDCLTHPYAFYVYFLYVYYGIQWLPGEIQPSRLAESNLFSMNLGISDQDFWLDGLTTGMRMGAWAWLAISPLLVPVETASLLGRIPTVTWPVYSEVYGPCHVGCVLIVVGKNCWLYATFSVVTSINHSDLCWL